MANMVIRCPCVCGNRVMVRPEQAGELVDCPQCGVPVLVPQARPATTPREETRPAEGGEPEADTRLGHRLTLLFTVILVLTLGAAMGLRIGIWLGLGYAAVVTACAIPALIGVSARSSIGLMSRSLSFLEDAVKAGSARWEQSLRRSLRDRWEREEQRALADWRRDAERNEQVRMERERNDQLEQMQRNLAQEMARSRQREDERRRLDAEEWDRSEKVRREGEKHAWEQTRRREVDEAVQRAQAQGKADAEKEAWKALEVWLKEQKRIQLDQIVVEISAERSKKYVQLQKDLDHDKKAMRNAWERENRPESFSWTSEWREIAEKSCPGDLKGFSGGGDVAYRCKRGCVYHPACIQAINWVCQAGPGDHSQSEAEFTKIHRWPGDRRPSSPPEIGHDVTRIRIDTDGQVEARTEPTNGTGRTGPTRTLRI